MGACDVRGEMSGEGLTERGRERERLDATLMDHSGTHAPLGGAGDLATAHEDIV